MGKPEGVKPHAQPKHDSEHPGYETQDVNVGGIITFIAGLIGSLLIFFVFCFAMGKAINYGLEKQDGPRDQWHATSGTLGETPRGEKREDLASNAEMEQKQLAQMAQTFPTPRLETDDGNQDISDLHAREDLLLNFYSTSADGTTRIPIDKAMQLIVQRGLPQPAGAAQQQQPLMAGERPVHVTAPLTDGFARTGYELDTIAAREQKLESENAMAEAEKK
jgi:hypothetical protein